METVLHTFQPEHTENQMGLWLGLLIGALALAGMLRLLKHKSGEQNRRLLGAMLLFFACTISVGTAFFSWLTMRKIGPVSLYRDAITTPYGKLDFDKIRSIYIKEEREKTLLKPDGSGKSTRLLVLESKDGKVHVLSDQNYNIQAILGTLKETIDASKGKQPFDEQK